MESSPKKPNPIDVHVGSRVKLRRSMLGLSQEKLGDSLGITFQQIQKYEKGTNRMGASRLYDIAIILKAPVSFFFEGVSNPHSSDGTAGFAEESGSSYVVDFLSTAEGIKLNTAFQKIADPAVRKKIIELMKSLGDDGE